MWKLKRSSKRDDLITKSRKNDEKAAIIYSVLPHRGAYLGYRFKKAALTADNDNASMPSMCIQCLEIAARIVPKKQMEVRKMTRAAV